MQFPMPESVVYMLLWVIFGLTHSLMASAGWKGLLARWLGPWACGERLLYNGVSLAMFAWVIGYGHNHLPKDPLFALTESWRLGLGVVQGGGVVLLLWALSVYDLPRFAGLRQIVVALRRGCLLDEPLQLSGPNRYFRHPLYSATLLIIWFRPWSTEVLLTNGCATLYLFIGMRFEERRLLAQYGERYAAYCREVPRLLPALGRSKSPLNRQCSR